MNEKVCLKCNKLKQLFNFVKDISKPDYRKSICKDCNKIYRKKYPSSKKQAEYILKHKLKKTRKTVKRERLNLIFLLKHRIKSLNTKKINLPIGDKKFCYYCNQYLSINEGWFHSNKNTRFSSICFICDKLKHAKRHKKRKEFISNKDLWSIFKAFNFSCFNCKNSNKRNMSIDHNNNELPLSFSNAVVLCVKCNSKKGSKKPKDFYSKEKLETLNKIIRQIKKENTY